jgi:hypothetical protein
MDDDKDEMDYADEPFLSYSHPKVRHLKKTYLKPWLVIFFHWLVIAIIAAVALQLYTQIRNSTKDTVFCKYLWELGNPESWTLTTFSCL